MFVVRKLGMPPREFAYLYDGLEAEPPARREQVNIRSAARPAATLTWAAA